MSRKPFTLIAALIFLLVALAHAYRLATGCEVAIGGWTVPMSVSWVGLAIGIILSLMLAREARR